MKIFGLNIGRKAIKPADLALELFEQAASKAGVSVTWETALQASTAFACARVIADGLAQVPLKLMRKLDAGGSDAATRHPLYEVVHRAPNAWTTSFEWRETMGMHLALCLRAYAIINTVQIGRARAVELLPIAPERVRTERNGNGLRYFARLTDEGSETEIPAARMLHLKGPSWNGWEGLDGVRLAREAIGLALATEEHGGRLFKNGAILGGLLSTEKELGKDQRDALRESWQAAQAGLANAYKTALLWGGIKWMPRGMQNDQAQWVEVRRFQVMEVCRFFRVLPIMVGEADKTATYASTEQMFLAHAVHTMGPWYTRIEQRLDLQLLTDADRAAGLYHHHTLTGLLRGSHRDRAEFYRVLHGLGAINANEIRALEEMNPYAAGNTYLQPLNMAPAGTLPAGDTQPGA